MMDKKNERLNLVKILFQELIEQLIQFQVRNKIFFQDNRIIDESTLYLRINIALTIPNDTDNIWIHH